MNSPRREAQMAPRAPKASSQAAKQPSPSKSASAIREASLCVGLLSEAYRPCQCRMLLFVVAWSIYWASTALVPDCEIKVIRVFCTPSAGQPALTQPKARFPHPECSFFTSIQWTKCLPRNPPVCCHFSEPERATRPQRVG